jgi:hypothetical protein
MKTSIVNINPKLAEYLLAFNNKNRSFRKHTLAYFITCLKEGSFHTTHQGIAMEGTLQNPIRIFDGQHRLMAIVSTGICANILVSENADIACYENADNGLPRSLSDRVGIKGKETAICSVFYYLCNSAHQKPSVDRIKVIYEIIQPISKYISMPGNRGLSLAGFTSAFIIQQKKYGFNNCDEFSSIDSKKVQNLAIKNPLLFSLKTRQSQYSTRGRLSHAEAFCAIWDCVERKDLKRLIIRGDATQRASNIIATEWPQLHLAALLSNNKKTSNQ